MAVNYSRNFDETIPFTDDCAQIALGANVAESYTIPGSATDHYSAKITYISTSNVFMRLNTAPTVPSAGSTATEPYNEFRGGDDGSTRYVQGGDVLHFITPDTTAYVGVRLMKLPM